MKKIYIYIFISVRFFCSNIYTRITYYENVNFNEDFNYKFWGYNSFPIKNSHLFITNFYFQNESSYMKCKKMHKLQCLRFTISLKTECASLL